MDSQSIDPSNSFFMFEVGKVCATCTKHLMKCKGYSLDIVLDITTNFKLYQVLESQFQFKYEEKGPNNVCPECYTKILAANQFQQQCMKSFTLFRKYMAYQEAFTTLDEIELSICEKSAEIEVENTAGNAEPVQISITDARLEKAEEEFKLLDQVESYGKHLKWVCKYCGLEFDSYNSTYREHLIIHERRFVCSICDKAFGSKHKLQRHEQLHWTKQQFQCEYCLMTFMQMTNLSKHISNTHFDEKNAMIYVCSFCEATFHNVTAYEYHVNVHKKKYSCKDCDKLFGCRRHLLHHMKLHTGELNYSCQLCSLAFKTKRGLYQHTSTHRPNVKFYKCDKCSNRYISQTLLTAHKMECHDIVDRDHKCPACDRTFQYSFSMHAHFKTHMHEVDIKQAEGTDEVSVEVCELIEPKEEIVVEDEGVVEHIVIEVNNDHLLSNSMLNSSDSAPE